MITRTFEDLVNTVVESKARARIVSATGHNRYGIDPGIINQLQETWIVEDAPTKQRLVIDGILHPGQIVDLSDTLPSVTVCDRRDVILRRLSDGNNQFATMSIELRQCRIDHRRAMQHQRHAATDGPDQSGRVNELTQRKQTLRNKIETAIADQQQSVKNAYANVDARISVISQIGTEPAANELYSSITPNIDSEITAILRPATPMTTVTTIGPHEVAVTRVTPFITDIPPWYERVIAGTLTILNQADVIAIAEANNRSHTDIEPANNIKRLPMNIQQQCKDDAEILLWAGESNTDDDSIRADIAAELPDTQVTISLPYTDDAQATVSWLYNNTTVESISYDERIVLTVRVAVTQNDAVQRAVTTVDGTIQDGEE